MPSVEQIDVDMVLAGLKHVAATAENEEELRIKASAILESEVTHALGTSAILHQDAKEEIED